MTSGRYSSRKSWIWPLLLAHAPRREHVGDRRPQDESEAERREHRDEPPRSADECRYQDEGLAGDHLDHASRGSVVDARRSRDVAHAHRLERPDQAVRLVQRPGAQQEGVDDADAGQRAPCGARVDLPAHDQAHDEPQRESHRDAEGRLDQQGGRGGGMALEGQLADQRHPDQHQRCDLEP
jgi:hypothetical protein